MSRYMNAYSVADVAAPTTSDGEWLQTASPWTTGSFSVATWFYRTSSTGTRPFFSMGRNNSSDYRAQASVSATLTGLAQSTLSSNASAPANSPSLNAWQHAVVIFNCTGTTVTSIRTVLNGDWASSTLSDITDRDIGVVLPNIIRISNQAALNSSSAFNGYVSEWAWWNKALSEAEVTALQTTYAGDVGGPVLYYPFDSSSLANEGSGGSTYDLTNYSSTYETSVGEPSLTGGGSVTISLVSDTTLNSGQTGITLTGSGFGDPQGTGKVYISPTDNIADSNKVEQTVNGWGNTSINITAVRGSLSHSTNLYVFVLKDGGTLSNSTGYIVQFNPDRKLKVLVHSSAAGATSVRGVVFTAPTGGQITGAEIGEFTSKTFEASLESGQAVLKVPIADFGGNSLTTSDTPVVLVRNDTNTTGIIQASIIEE